MNIGYNHNIRYEGRIFHVQTEDSGLSNPRIITHLFVGGNILATSRDNYQDLLEQGLGESSLEEEIKSRMKAQHVAMIKALKAGEHAERAKLFPDAKHAETTTVVNAVETIQPDKEGPLKSGAPPLDASPTQRSLPASLEDFAPVEEAPKPRPNTPVSGFVRRPIFAARSPEKSTLDSPTRKPSLGTDGGEQSESRETSTSSVHLVRRTGTSSLLRPSFQPPPSSASEEQQDTREDLPASSALIARENRSSGTARPVLNLSKAPRTFRPPTKDNS